MSKSRISLYEEQNKGAIKWFIVLAVALAIIGVVFIPNVSEWNSKRQETKQIRLTNNLLQTRVDDLQSSVDKLNNQITAKQALAGNTEEQVLPVTVDPGKIAQVLELYAEALQNADYLSYLIIDRINVSQTQNVEAQPYAITNVGMTFTANRRAFDSLINYIQQGDLNIDTSKAFRIEEVIAFIEANRLPIATISSINITETDDAEIDNLLSATIDMTFYSQRKQDTSK